jgi:hypothetical protein
MVIILLFGGITALFRGYLLVSGHWSDCPETVFLVRFCKDYILIFPFVNFFISPNYNLLYLKHTNVGKYVLLQRLLVFLTVSEAQELQYHV